MPMITANEILAAVQAGGMNSPAWQPKCEQKQREKQRKSPTHQSLENDLISMMEALGTDQLSCSDWAKRMDWKPETIRKRADILVRRKLVRRSTWLMPYKYFKC